MAMRIKLREPVFFQGRLYRTGEYIDWPHDIEPPLRTVVDASYAIGTNIPAAELRAKCDTPLFEIVD